MSRTIKSLPEMEKDMIAEMETASERKKRIYKVQNAVFQREQLATDMQSAIQTINTEKRVRVNFQDPEDVRQRIVDYFTACANTGRFPSIQGLAAYGFGISRQALNQWRNRQTSINVESARLIEIAADIIADTLTNQSLHNNANPAQTIFQLKNNHSFADVVEIQSTPVNDDDYMSPEEWESRKNFYKEKIREERRLLALSGGESGKE